METILANSISERMIVEYKGKEFKYEYTDDFISILDNISEEEFLKHQFVIEMIMVNLRNDNLLRKYVGIDDSMDIVDNDIIIFFIIKKKFNIFKIIQDRFHTLTNIPFELNYFNAGISDFEDSVYKSYRVFRDIILSDIEVPLPLYGFVSKLIIRSVGTLVSTNDMSISSESMIDNELLISWTIFHSLFESNDSNNLKYLINKFPDLCMNVSSILFLNIDNPYYIKEVREECSGIIEYSLKGVEELELVLNLNDITPTKSEVYHYIDKYSHEYLILKLYQEYDAISLVPSRHEIKELMENDPSCFVESVIRSRDMKINKFRNYFGLLSMFDYEPCGYDLMYVGKYRDFSYTMEDYLNGIYHK